MNDNINIPDSTITTNLTFRQLVLMNMQQLTNFPYIEKDFDALTDYELLSLVVKYLNDVIANQNEQNDSITRIYNSFLALQTYVNNTKDTLEDAFNTLNDYVRDYFANLDVQEEINNKIDDMMDDGTFQNIITSYAQEVLDALTEEVTTAVKGIETEVERYRKEYYNDYTYYKPTALTDSFFDNVTLFRSNDKANFKYFENIKNSFKNVPTFENKNVYVSPDGNDSTGHGTESEPYFSINKGLSIMNDGDTLIIKEGIYYRVQEYISKSINIIGDGDVIISDTDNVEWTQNATYSNVYQINRTNISNRIIDLRQRDKGVYNTFTLVNSIEEVSQTPYSYYYDSPTIYANNGGVVSKTNTAVPIQLGHALFTFTASNSDINVYMENLKFIGGSRGCVVANATSSYVPTITCVDCDMLFGGGAVNNNYEVVASLGAKTIMLNCKANYGRKDGFNYHAGSGHPAYAIEINCEGSNNGHGREDNTCNGSTAHDGSKVLRLNGVYFNNQGSNVADVHENTVSYNINCKSFDSKATEQNVYSSDFGNQQAGCIMYLVNCFAQGNSAYNLQCQTGSTIYIDNTKYDNRTGNGSFIDI